MPVTRVQATLKHDSGLPEDVTTNTFHFETGAGTPLQVCDLVAAFYRDPPVGSNISISGMLSKVLTGELTCKAYNLGDPIPRTPSAEENYTIVVSNGDALPSEVAIVASYRAAAQSGVSAARRRGRIYLGPLAKSVIDPAGTTPRPSEGNLTLIGNSFKQLVTSAGQLGWPMVVLSRTAAGASLVTNGYVDDAFDTQRRRGEAPTTRVSWSL